MATNAENKTNIFSFIPKSISSEAFLVWLINYLDSDSKYSLYKQSLFDNLLLKREDKGKSVSQISINRQGNNTEAVLSFHFNGTDERHDILLLFVDKESNMIPPEQLDRYKRFYPNCYRYIYYKMRYVTTIEERIVTQNQYKLVTSCMMESVLESISELHPLIKIYADYLDSEGESLNYYHERLFLNHEKEILHDSAAQKYLLDTILENIAEDNWIIKIE